jgi:NAD(P)-dependent dehydrogenase (short-subunit alcohol dehydrogenase family)
MSGSSGMPPTGPFDLGGASMLVTGAAGLVGRLVLQAFLEAGGRVVGGVHREESAEELQAAFADYGDAFGCVVLDITDDASVARGLADVVARFGGLDVLVNNAGIDAKFDAAGDRGLQEVRFEEYPLERVAEALQVNTLGTVRVTQAACAQMLRQSAGIIINVASVYSLVAPDQSLYLRDGEPARYKPADYVVSKSFLPNFTRYIATLYAGKGIRCNAIAFHGVENDHDEQFRRRFAQLSPAGRMCRPDELGGAFVFLASAGASYMNGSVLTLDGGWSAR